MDLELLFKMGNLSATGRAFELLGELRTLLSAFSWFIKGCCRTFTWLSALKPMSRAAAAAAGEETDDAGEGNGAAIESFTGDLRLLSAKSLCSGGFSAGSGGFLWYNSSSF